MKQIRSIKCLIPFTHFGVHYQGYCYSCCPNWSKMGNVGRLTDQNSIMDFWNSEKMQEIRRAVLNDNLKKVCNLKYCPMAIANQEQKLETIIQNDPSYSGLIDEIRAGRTILHTPPRVLEVANTGKCNLNCVMCISNDRFLEHDDVFEERLYTQLIPEILPDLTTLFMCGNGEVLFNPQSRKFLQTLDSKHYPSLSIRLLTNGTLLTPKVWESISHNRFERITVSIDAASKQTYEYIRRNGNWDILRRNLDFISELKRRKTIPNFWINFVVMKSNYKEMKDFVELGLTLGCDHIVFQKIFGEADPLENINLNKNKHVLAEIGEILTDPIFNRPEVDLTIITEYRKNTGKRTFFNENIFAKVKG